jgi:hypothetical protein
VSLTKSFDDSRRFSMLHKTLLLAVAIVLAALVSAAEARAWGGYHVGYTHVGPAGAYHWGRTGVAGPYGAYRGGSAYGYRGYDAYRGGYGSYHAYGGYHYGGYYGGTRAGFYRRW